MSIVTEQEIMAKVDTFIADNTEALVADLGRLIAISSVEDLRAAAPGAPFGPNVRRALDEALEMARKMGLSTNDGQGYIGWAELPGKDPRHIATITHLDVVPEGEGWDGSPYEMRRQDGWLLGRGVADDKGPSILCLYAAKFFKDLGEEQRYTLRVLLGCAEETGMKDVSYYFEHQPQPLFCFSPDAEFPVCNGEKGHQNGIFVSDILGGNIVEFAGGIANNVIPDRASCLVKADGAKLLNNDHITVTPEGDMVRIEARGIGGHAAMPKGTRNAIGLIINYLLENAVCTEKENRFLQLLKKLHDVTDGGGLGIACSDDVFDPLTCIGGIIKLEEGRLRQYMDIRFPTSTTSEKMRTRLRAEAEEADATFEGARGEEPFYIPADSAPIQTLLAAYGSVTGREAKTFTMGGGTYARNFENAVSFGPEEMDAPKPDFVGTMHGANEGAELKAMLLALKVYIVALWKLQQLDF